MRDSPFSVGVLMSNTRTSSSKIMRAGSDRRELGEFALVKISAAPERKALNNSLAISLPPRGRAASDFSADDSSSFAAARAMPPPPHRHRAGPVSGNAVLLALSEGPTVRQIYNMD